MEEYLDLSTEELHSSGQILLMEINTNFLISIIESVQIETKLMGTFSIFYSSPCITKNLVLW